LKPPEEKKTIGKNVRLCKSNQLRSQSIIEKSKDETEKNEKNKLKVRVEEYKRFIENLNLI
jgi:hypothetical protein